LTSSLLALIQLVTYFERASWTARGRLESGLPLSSAAPDLRGISLLDIAQRDGMDGISGVGGVRCKRRRKGRVKGSHLKMRSSATAHGSATSLGRTSHTDTFGGATPGAGIIRRGLSVILLDFWVRNSRNCGKILVSYVSSPFRTCRASQTAQGGCSESQWTLQMKKKKRSTASLRGLAWELQLLQRNTTNLKPQLAQHLVLSSLRIITVLGPRVKEDGPRST